MKVLICVEERGGTLFNGRRTSSDRNVSRDMLREAGSLLPEGRLLSPEAVMAEGKRLWISPFSKKLFRGKGDYLVIVDDPLQDTLDGVDITVDRSVDRDAQAEQQEERGQNCVIDGMPFFLHFHLASQETRAAPNRGTVAPAPISGISRSDRICFASSRPTRVFPS